MEANLQNVIKVLSDVNDEIDFASEQNMVDDGLLDSFELIKMISALDEAFGIHIDAGAIEPENFNSAEAILDLVKALKS